MRKIIGILFPWRQTYMRLELEKHWWHRMAVVLFFVTFISLLLYSGFLGYAANEPYPTQIPDITYWNVVSNPQPPPSPAGYTPVQTDENKTLIPPGAVVGQPLPMTQKTIEMPDGKIATFPGSMSDDAIDTEWNRKLDRANIQAILFGFGIAIAAVVLLSYLLQGSYRALLYVIYGVRTKARPETPISS